MCYSRARIRGGQVDTHVDRTPENRLSGDTNQRPPRPEIQPGEDPEEL